MRALVRPKRPTPADWGIGVSVCLASIAFHGKEQRILSMSDKMVSTALGEVTLDAAAMKQQFFHGNWLALFAATDIGAVMPVLRRCALKLEHAKNYAVDDVISKMVNAFDEERSARAASSVLGVYGLSMESFLKMGYAQFGPERFGKMCDELQGFILDIDFLVCGFDADGQPHIFDLTAGTPHDHEPMGYWAIGIGAKIALASLSARKHTMYLEQNKSLYNLFQARFLAESSYGVGRAGTVGAVLRFNKKVSAMPKSFSGEVKQHWEKHVESTPTGAMALIDKWFSEIG